MTPFDKIHISWSPLMYLFNQEDFLHFRTEILSNTLYYPEKFSIFRVFSMPVSEIKIVILGQDPYYNFAQANGLAFAVNESITTPPSLRNISRELTDEGLKECHDFNTPWKTLEHWHEQGVFLLNTALTVEAGKPESHLKYWENFTKKVIAFIAYNNPCIWMLWGQKAQSFAVNLPSKSIFNVQGYDDETINQIPINVDYNYVFKAAHPAAESYRPNAGFFGCNHFKFSNKILTMKGQTSINW